MTAYIPYLDPINDMVFHVGESYSNYKIESRTKCFVTFIGGGRKKISHTEDGVEQFWIGDHEFMITAHDLDEQIVHEFKYQAVIDQPESAEVTAPDAPIFITPSANPIVTPQPISGANDNEPIIVSDSLNQQWRLVDADTQNCLFEAVEHREIGNAPRTRTMPLKQLQALYGWGEPKRDPHVRPSYMGIGIEVHCGDEANGFALAELIWYKREDDPDWAELERERMARMWDRDCDLAADFGMTARI